MVNKVIILGNHPLANSLLKQYGMRGSTAEHLLGLVTDSVKFNDYDEICLLADKGENDKAIAMLSKIAEKYDLNSHQGNRLTCHLLVQGNKTLQFLQTCDLCDAVRQKIDVYPFTMDEVWSRSIVLDYQPLTVQSDKHVHLVIFGMGEIAEMVAIQAAHVSHYPNYVRNHSLRTRITMIDVDAEEKRMEFVKRYQHLFNNCYYRVVNPSKEKVIIEFHEPMYAGKRENFVDVEWEFVEANYWDAELRDKLKFWANDSKQLLTLVMADEDGDKNKKNSLLLPQELYNQSIPIYNYNEQFHGYDVTLPLIKMAKNVNYVYDRCFNDNIVDWKGSLRYCVEIDSIEREKSWAKLSNVKRMSSIYNALTIPTKMRSIGLQEDDWDKFYDISQQDIELLAQVEHNRWCVEELILGFRPCTDDEYEIISSDVATQKDAYKSRKVHYDLRAYNNLKPDKTGRSVQIYDLCLSSCLPLIAKAFVEEKGGIR